MTDTFSKEKRSEIMRSVKSHDSKIELAVRKLFWNSGFRYRKNSKNYFGKPDITLKKHKTVVFVDSCFWHGCRKHFRAPETRKEYWIEKIKRNKKRDKSVNQYYKNLNWTVFRIWEHDLKRSEEIIPKFLNKLSSKKN
jgi:DNA mismatch endonuclease (patch repair protein)